MSDNKKECEMPFWKDPSVLFHNFSLQYQPICEHSMWNFVTRLALLSLFVGLIASAFGGVSAIIVAVLFGCITAFAIIMTTPRTIVPISQSALLPSKLPDKYNDLPYTVTVDPSGYLSPLQEHFVNGGSASGSVQPNGEPIGVAEVDAAPYSGASLPDYTPPTSRNLFMNVLLDEIKYNPNRPDAAPIGNPTVKQTMDDFFRVQWFSDPTDVFGKNQNQRQYITQPSTTVPNDQGSFANWLYKIPGKTCKEGGRAACLSGTDGSPVPWLNNSS
jgi:hypothetical protein